MLNIEASYLPEFEMIQFEIISAQNLDAQIHNEIFLDMIPSIQRKIKSSLSRVISTSYLCLFCAYSSGGGDPVLIQRRTNLVIERPSEEHQKSSHVIDTPINTMYIMGDLGVMDG